MSNFGWFIGGYVAGFAVCLAVGVPYLKYLQHELRITHDRLYGAWEQGKVIPPRNDEPPEMQLPPLPGDLQAYVEEWESADSRLAVEATIRKMQAQGQSATQIHNHFLTERLRMEG